MSMDERVDFAAELAQLEDIVRRLEGEELDLDEALRLFEDGVTRLRRAREQLAAAEVRVRQVLAERGGALRVEPLDG
jgi:exodeoxyribonuclease VII small subunit